MDDDRQRDAVLYGYRRADVSTGTIGARRAWTVSVISVLRCL
jgi:hypothetical protein